MSLTIEAERAYGPADWHMTCCGCGAPIKDGEPCTVAEDDGGFIAAECAECQP